MLINLSNHPSVSWPAEQLLAASEQYGDVLDFPFPQIAAELTTEDINKLALSFLRQIQESFPKQTLYANAVLVLGEFVFTYQMVKLLEENGITALATNSLREVFEDGNKKYSVFRFMGFRAYTKQ